MKYCKGEWHLSYIKGTQMLGAFDKNEECVFIEKNSCLDDVVRRIAEHNACIGITTTALTRGVVGESVESIYPRESHRGDDVWEDRHGAVVPTL